MSFAAEPFGVFVDDLVSALTGGVTREELVFTGPDEPYRLAFGADFMPGTVRAHGLVESEYFRFHDGVDFKLDPAGRVVWLAAAGGGPRAGAHWPDLGSHFYVSYERKPEVRPAPQLTDRNPGSVLRTLAESFAREFAIVSKQLDRVYDAGFVETAEDRDLDHVVALVGVERRSRTVAQGEVVFGRTTPAPADIFIPEGTLLSTKDAPQVTVETVEVRTLHAGTASVSAPVQALVAGPDGVALAGRLTVIHRPILGIESAVNPTPMAFSGGTESDAALRRRAQRALETGGRSTVSTLIGALLSCGLREENIRVTEDHVAFPGTVKVVIAGAEGLDASTRTRAAALIDDYRPAGVRVLHNLPIAPPPSLPPSTGTGGAPPGPAPPPATPAASSETTFAIGVTAAVTPASAALSASQKAALRGKVEEALAALVASYGIGEHVIYNQLVAAAMGVEGANDVSIDVYRVTTPPGPAAGRQNLPPPSPSMKPTLAAADLKVSLRGALVALDVTVDVQRLGLAASGDPEGALAAIRDEIVASLGAFATSASGTVTPAALQAVLGSPNYAVARPLRYTAELLDEGLRILRENVPLPLDPEQQLWIRTVNVVEGASSS